MAECCPQYMVELRENLECQKSYNSCLRLGDLHHRTGWIGAAIAPLDPLVRQNDARAAKRGNIVSTVCAYQSVATLGLYLHPVTKVNPKLKLRQQLREPESLQEI
jgi:hypothetical protein